ncbi:pectin lyase fold/virulence factor [Aspergillus ambiguus]|uniref:pectin lyase fold/virulence factor n=1 Tax=Aspergillus ambiguus TaxID=176160 RepID=UPI003CCE13BE
MTSSVSQSRGAKRNMTSIQTYDSPPGIPINRDFIVEVQPATEAWASWRPVPAYATDVANVNTTSNIFDRHTVAVASFDLNGPVRIKATYTAGPVHSAEIRPRSLNISTQLENNTILFTLDRARDVMLEINNDKWTALHLLTNEIDVNAPTEDTDDVWYFGPGLNQGTAYSKITDGVNLAVPSGKTVYLAGGAFIDFRLNFLNVSDSAVCGHGFLLGPQGGFTYRELGGPIHMNGARNIRVEGVTSLGSYGFSLSAGECQNVVVNQYRSFSFSGNGDGIDFFCSSDITIENCFLRNSDDNIALYSHRWEWYGDSTNITIQNCVLLPDIAHGINMGTHGNPDRPETTSNVVIRNIDILDQEENQVWYQGCIAINAADENLFRDIHVEDVRVERITRGQLFNLHVMHNAMYNTKPGRGIQNVTLKNLSLSMRDSKIVNPSQLIGYDQSRQIENVTFENLSIEDKVIHNDMEKPRWFMTEDFVPAFINEHVKGLEFLKTV